MLVLVVRCCILAWRSRSPVVPREGGTAVQGTAWTFALLLTAAFFFMLLFLPVLAHMDRVKY